MKAAFISTVLAAGMLGTSNFVAAGPVGPEGAVGPAGPLAPSASAPGMLDGPGGKKGVAPPPTPMPMATTTMTTSSRPTTSSAPSSSSMSSKPTSNTISSSVSSGQLSTMSNTIAVSSFMTSASSTFLSASSPTPSAESILNIASTTSPTPSPSSKNTSSSHQTLIIVLSTVLGSLVILLIAAAIFLAYRFGQKRGPLGRRGGVTPINDDEIDSWRGSSTDQKKQLSPVDPAMLNNKSETNTIALTYSPGWTWTASPTSLRSPFSPTTTVPDTPQFLARAPNSRAGLTDETVPGADAFIPPIKRQSSRLSKHGRSKSRRSSMSGKSVRSYNGGIGPTTDVDASEKMPPWYDPENHVIKQKLSRLERVNSTPGGSIFEGTMFEGNQAGGLAPRPGSHLRPWDRDRKRGEIGRAIA